MTIHRQHGVVGRGDRHQLTVTLQRHTDTVRVIDGRTGQSSDEPERRVDHAGARPHQSVPGGCRHGAVGRLDVCEPIVGRLLWAQFRLAGYCRLEREQLGDPGDVEDLAGKC